MDTRRAAEGGLKLARTPYPDDAVPDSGTDKRLLWAGLLIAAVLFAKYPTLDLQVSALCFSVDDGFFLAKNTLVLAMYMWTPILGRTLFVLVLLHALLAPWLSKALASRGRSAMAERCRGAWRHMSIIFVLATLLGPGVLIEGVLKNTVGRPRPVQIVQFGGEAAFHAPFSAGINPESHRSFVSSHAATGFALMALGLTSHPAVRRRWLMVGLLTGGAIGAGRMLQGGHFLSDVVFAFYAVWLSCELVVWLDRKRLLRRTHAHPPSS
jgi:lipid A 4'-phosphatase